MPTTAVIQTRFQTVDGVRIRCAESGGPHERTVLLTSPWPESVYAFAQMWSSLAEHARLFAVDLPGFGASERRDDLLSPRAMGDFLATLIDEVGLGVPHIVAGRRDVGRPVRGGRTSRADRERGLLRRRPLRRVDALCAPVSRGAAPACRAAATDHHTGHDHQRPPRHRRSARQRRVPRRGLPTSRLAIIDAGHFIWEEAPAEYASIVIDSITA